MLKKHMPADGVDEGAEAFRLAQSAIFAQDREDASKRLLTHVLYRLWRLQPRAKFQAEEQGKVTNEMLLRWQVPCAQALDVTCIE